MRYNGKIPDESATNLDLNLSEAGKLSFEIHTPLLNKYGGDNPYMDCPEARWEELEAKKESFGK